MERKVLDAVDEIKEKITDNLMEKKGKLYKLQMMEIELEEIVFNEPLFKLPPGNIHQLIRHKYIYLPMEVEMALTLQGFINTQGYAILQDSSLRYVRLSRVKYGEEEGEEYRKYYEHGYLPKRIAVKIDAVDIDEEIRNYGNFL